MGTIEKTNFLQTLPEVTSLKDLQKILLLKIKKTTDCDQ